MATLTQAIPAMPVRDAATAVDFYRDRLGFEVLHHDGGFAVLRRNDAVLHPVSTGGVDETEFGTREFATLDQDGNLATFSQSVSS